MLPLIFCLYNKKLKKNNHRPLSYKIYLYCKVVIAGPAQKGARKGLPPPNRHSCPPINKRTLLKEAAFVLRTLAPLSRLLWRRICIIAFAIAVLSISLNCLAYRMSKSVYARC